MEINKTRSCHVCGSVCTEACPVCTEAFEHRRPVKDMSIEDRVAEMQLLRGTVEISFDKIHLRFSELVGRSIFTHELAWVDDLIAEVRQGSPATFAEVISKIPAEKLIVVNTA